MKIEHPGTALWIVFGVAALLFWFGVDKTVELAFLVFVSVCMYKWLTARRHR